MRFALLCVTVYRQSAENPLSTEFLLKHRSAGGHFLQSGFDGVIIEALECDRVIKVRSTHRIILAVVLGGVLERGFVSIGINALARAFDSVSSRVVWFPWAIPGARTLSEKSGGHRVCPIRYMRILCTTVPRFARRGLNSSPIRPISVSV